MLSTKKKEKLCLQCAECCKILAVEVTLQSMPPEAIAFYVTRGCWLATLSGGRLGLVIPYQCPHLTPEGCDIYEDRPLVCKDYDGTRDPLMKDKCLWIRKNRR